MSAGIRAPALAPQPLAIEQMAPGSLEWCQRATQQRGLLESLLRISNPEQRLAAGEHRPVRVGRSVPHPVPQQPERHFGSNRRNAAADDRLDGVGRGMSRGDEGEVVALHRRDLEQHVGGVSRVAER
jgi:hypothetical protein